MNGFQGYRSGAIGSSEGVLELWHNHRLSILSVAASILMLILLGLSWFRKHEASPVILERGMPSTKTATTEQPPVREEKAVPLRVTPKETTDGPRRIKGEPRKPNGLRTVSKPNPERRIQVLVFYSSLTGTTEKIASGFLETLKASLEEQDFELRESILEPQVLDLAQVDYDEYFISPPKPEDPNSPVDYLYLFLLPSYNIDTINENLLEHLKETHHDFRIDTAPLSGLLGYSVFGLGDREGWPTEEDGFCFQAKEVDKWMAKLTGRKRAYPLGMGDSKRDLTERLSEWTDGVRDVLKLIASTGSLGEGVPGSGDADESDYEEASGEEDDDVEVMIDESALSRKQKKARGGNIDDLEDLGRIMKSSQDDSKPSNKAAPIAVDFTTYSKRSSKKPPQSAKEMVPKESPTYKSLTKQGYSIVGSHSGVKICRWTKSALRGRGSCYKFSFYGIASHQCMETTPSLSCSNKCVFCWRHGTNPVGTTWRWVVDPPDLIFSGVKAGHYQKIKMMRGVPGVRAERFAEAMRIRHCALSLVGEPIFYPYINEFLAMLHGERISSFLVCNAQHPDQLAALKAVTQLYVSIDASNKESLRKIDRPLHRDFWERFQRCLDILREKRFKQRTVFRLTLVKGFNVDDEVQGYADLVEKGLPCFVEIKGVTYCGTSTSAGAGLSMANVPFYAEVTDFVEALDAELRKRGLGYGIAAEHAHSCCVLIASERFRVDGRWHTRIDYQRFFELLEERGADGEWTPEDYMGPETPEWATWGNGGFDPRDDRVDRKGRKIEAA
ncbi:Uu.00g016430.m01.CDS01 [Anthostomella pinea]|uniref:S-adenosyl-L-methionine-dependent tRNA 4-demethylwyosine synthase n=1 Tax=Anthostomella pinea TaxID=933095 RepID=A0AAI8VYP5_9PEZI|nr:Uu.00g016430.m01.CDS01 [Anthostomella pinea]